jgi:hypothetical protein
MVNITKAKSIKTLNLSKNILILDNNNITN